MESVKSIVKDVVYGKSKIHTNMEFTFSNNNKHIDNGPFGSIAKNSSIANDLYRIFEEIDENNRGEHISTLEIHEIEEDLEI